MITIWRGLHTPGLIAATLALGACGGSSSDSGPSGLDARPDNTLCLASRFQPQSELELEPLVEEGTFTAPVGVVSLPTEDDIFYVLEQHGMIWRLDRSEDGDPEPFVDLREYTDIYFRPDQCHECGLFSLAFHPDFAQNGYIYLSFTEGGEPESGETEGGEGTAPESHVARFRSADGGLSLERDGEALERDSIYHLVQTTDIHNNGRLAFGPDGYLYVSFGDGGPGGDPYRNAQNPGNAFGSLLRLTDEGQPAPGNAVEGGLPEVYAYGLRNAWQWSFDRASGELWAGDVGQGRTEEINRIVNGGNYGWPCREGLEAMHSCVDEADFQTPVWVYGREEGQSVTGGYVYRGQALDDLYGTYLFSDFGSGLLWGLFENVEGDYERRQLLDTGGSVVAFGEDNDGELLVVDYLGGQVSRLVPAQADPERGEVPVNLSETGCMAPDDPRAPGPRLIPYEVREPFWSDGADKERYMALPNGASITPGEDGDFDLPVGTILVKQFRLRDRLIETRLLLNQEKTGWVGYSYRWNEAETEAERLSGARDLEVEGQLWHYPSGAECSQCHTAAAGDSLGLEVRQLDHSVIYSATGREANQLDTLAAIGVLEEPVAGWQREPALVASDDESASLDRRARSYLHSNCSHCHRPGGTSQASMDLRFETLPEAMNLCDAEPRQGNLGIERARLLVAGEAERSLLWRRLVAGDGNRMPPVGGHLPDEMGEALIGEWIDDMEHCSGLLAPEGVPVRIQNQASEVSLGTAGSASEEAEPWLLVAQSPYYQLRRAESDHYLHAEGEIPAVEPVDTGWLSAQWFPEVRDGQVRLRNRWKSDQYLAVDPDSGELQLVAYPALDEYALWRFDEVSR